jgi:hypothetical protein
VGDRPRPQLRQEDRWQGHARSVDGAARRDSSNFNDHHAARWPASHLFLGQQRRDPQQRRQIGPGIDVRGNGGYICLPPSRNATGGEYRWDPDSATQSAWAPPWLVTLAKATKAKAWAKAALERECKAVASAQPGTRNSALNTAAFNLFQIVAGGGLDEQEVRDRLFEAAETCGLVADDGAAAA